MPRHGRMGIHAFVFCHFLLQIFQRISARWVSTLKTQTEIGPKSPFHELSESSTPIAPQLWMPRIDWGGLNSIDFDHIVLQTFQWSSKSQVTILTTQTKTGPKSPFCEPSKSPTPSAIAVNATKWKGEPTSLHVWCNIPIRAVPNYYCYTGAFLLGRPRSGGWKARKTRIMGSHSFFYSIVHKLDVATVPPQF